MTHMPETGTVNPLQKSGLCVMDLQFGQVKCQTTECRMLKSILE